MTVMTTTQQKTSLQRIKLAYQRIRINIAENMAEEESSVSTPVSTRGSSESSLETSTLSNVSSIERSESELKEERTEKLLRIKTMYKAISKEADTESWIELMRRQRDSAARSCREQYEATPDFSNSVNLCLLAKDPQWQL
eukprot:TRINITY_DN25268_c0_g1_i1.p1 TRINITY_DN25268_c0_g1~~TRINITY_DN25268_c0_g1_i1.p1  ORF type:complete len:140 (+),score=23.65 TRINITY_DN25268_c0_g1_i1:86-505(+)